MNPTITLTVPARPEFISEIRSVIGSAAVRHDFTYEAVEDLRLAVDEACTRLLVIAKLDSQISMEIVPIELGISVRVSVPVDLQGVPTEEPWPTSEERENLAWTVMHALASEVDAGVAGDQAWVHLSKLASPTG